MRVSQFLLDEHIAFEELLHPPAFTSQKLAKALHVSGLLVMKSILLKGSRGDFVAVLPAARQIDLARLALTLGGAVRLASEPEVHERFADCEWGALIPFGRLYGLTTLLEATVPLESTIVFEAQRHAVAIRMRCRDFVKLERPERVAFAVELATLKHPRPHAG
ncbi:MAG: YbaK/EbsC family protein [Planctomycetes bacterium]|nr:YbaK/EbsC family protein [Planctomycetota bacterium]